MSGYDRLGQVISAEIRISQVILCYVRLGQVCSD
jgi:hypothetical protein